MRQSADPGGKIWDKDAASYRADPVRRETGVVKRIIGSALRAVLMAVLVAVPSLVLPSTTNDAAQITALVALVAAVVTFAEYYSEYPTFLEFRDAAPFNRLRFLGLFFCVLAASILTASHGDAPPNALQSFSDGAAQMLDIPFSPIRLLMIAFADMAHLIALDLVAEMASAVFVIAGAVLLLFWIHARFIFWPIRKKAFNFWINLPLFDPTSGRDVLFRLKRDASLNLVLGFLLPFILPALLKLWIGLFDPAALTVPEVMIWVVCAWAFLPLTLMMRGIALLRVAALIEEKRRRAYAQELQAA
ncbi:hypothetical protein [Marivita sp. GX14005]|uniref:hypothetical protein n=1 Tax=Marivita sp. GX14005 TaxID=2942276 RepID=UPI002018C943|nr:hypothetical protein [Marivita sp. GX14005]MCL3881675.1 hypothetical protein [Marivita sp. GX14005]